MTTTSTTRRYRSVRLQPGTDNICITTGKRQFSSESLAEQELQRCRALRNRQRNSRIEARYYVCPMCMQYHLTSK